MNDSTNITNAGYPASATARTKAVDDDASINSGSYDEESKRKRSKHRRRDGVRTNEKRRSMNESRSRRYYSDNEDDSSDSDSSAYRKRRKKRKKKKAQKEKRRSNRKDRDRRKRRKRRRSYSSSSDSSISSYSSASSDSDRKRKKKRGRNKKRKRQDTDRSCDSKDQQRLSNEQEQRVTKLNTDVPNENSAKIPVPEKPIDKPKRKAMIPMSKEEYDKEQSKIREVYDPLSGRMRLVRGNGEIIERIVSSAAHRQINSLATSGDGLAFSRGIYDKLKR